MPVPLNIDNERFPGNANRNKNPENKPVEMVVSKPAIKKKKSTLKKISENIFEDDDGEKISSLILHEIVIPTAKDTVSNIVKGIMDTVMDTVDRLLFGTPNYKRISNRNRRDRYTNVRSSQRSSRRDIPSKKYGVDLVEFDTREDAQRVLNELLDTIDEYNAVSVSTYYDLAGTSSGDFTDEKWGWDDLRNARICRSGNNFYLNLPKPIYLDD